jgi:ADP-ribose pyrophosphatase YjhB (NUDIX family)
MLLVEHEKGGRRYWLVPGGGVEMGETLHASAAREVLEETGFAVSIGRLQVVCEAIEPGGRHIVNLVYAGAVTGGTLAVGVDKSLRDAVWQPRTVIAGLTMYPPIGDALLACWDDGFAGPVRELGNIWR